MSRSSRTRSMLARAKAAEAEKQTKPAAKPATTAAPSGGKLGKTVSSVVQQPQVQKPQVLPLPRVQTQDIPVPQNIVQALQGLPNKTPQSMPSGGKVASPMPMGSKTPTSTIPQRPMPQSMSPGGMPSKSAFQSMPNKSPMQSQGASFGERPQVYPHQISPIRGTPKPPQDMLMPAQAPFAAQPSNFTAPSWMTAAPQGGIGNLLNQIR